MKARRWLVAALALILVAGASFALSTAICSRERAGRAAMGRCASVVTAYLGLTEEQARRVEPIDQAFQTDQQAICQEMRAARAGLLSVLQETKPDQADINKALDDIAASQSKLQRRAAQYLLELKQVLTKDQQAKLFDLVGQRFCEQGKCGGGMCSGMSGPGRGKRLGWGR